MSKHSDSFDELPTREVRKELRFDSRSTNSVVALILGLARYGIKKTDLVYDASLSLSLLTKYTEFLKNQSLIEERVSFDTFDERSSSVIFTTKKGINFLEKYNALARIGGDLFSEEPIGRHEDNRLRLREDELRF